MLSRNNKPSKITFIQKKIHCRLFSLSDNRSILYILLLALFTANKQKKQFTLLLVPRSKAQKSGLYCTGWYQIPEQRFIDFPEFAFNFGEHYRPHRVQISEVFKAYRWWYWNSKMSDWLMIVKWNWKAPLAAIALEVNFKKCQILDRCGKKKYF